MLMGAGGISEVVVDGVVGVSEGLLLMGRVGWVGDGRRGGWRNGAGEYITGYIIHTMRGGARGAYFEASAKCGLGQDAIIVAAKSASGREGSPPRRSIRSR